MLHCAKRTASPAMRTQAVDGDFKPTDSTRRLFLWDFAARGAVVDGESFNPTRSMHAQSAEPAATQQTRKAAERVGGRVQPLQQFDTGTNTGRRPFFVTLKPKHFPNRSTLGRFLDPFNMSECALGNRAPLDNKNNKKLISGNAPIVALEYWGASTWWIRHRVIDHTILTSIYTTKP